MRNEITTNTGGFYVKSRITKCKYWGPGGHRDVVSVGPISRDHFDLGSIRGMGNLFAIGGDNAALTNTIVCTVFGAIMAFIAALIIVGIPLANALTLPVWAAIVVGVTVLIMCLAAHIEFLSKIPASVLGYASTFAYLLQTPDALSMGRLTAANFGNALIIVGLSLIVGAIFGFISGKVGTALAKASE